MFAPTTAILLAAVAFNAASTLAVAVPTGAKSVAPQASGAAKYSEPKLMATGHVHNHHEWKHLLQQAAAGKPIVVTTFGKNNVPNGAHNVTSEAQWEAILKAADGGPIVISTFGATPVPAQVTTNANGTAHAHAINGTTSALPGTPPAASLLSLASAYGTKATATASSSAKATGTASVTSSAVASATASATKGKRDFEEEFYAREFDEDMEAREFFDDEDVLAREFYDDEDILAREFEDDMEARDYEDELAARFERLNFVNKTPVFNNRIYRDDDELAARFERLNFVNKTPVFNGKIYRDYEEAEFYGREYESMEDLE